MFSAIWTAAAKADAPQGTIQVDGKIIRSGFNRARRIGLIANNPAEAVELAARESVERSTFTPTEIKMLVEAAEGEWKALISPVYYTGQRLMDCANQLRHAGSMMLG